MLERREKTKITSCKLMKSANVHLLSTPLNHSRSFTSKRRLYVFTFLPLFSFFDYDPLRCFFFSLMAFRWLHYYHLHAVIVVYQYPLIMLQQHVDRTGTRLFHLFLIFQNPSISCASLSLSLSLSLTHTLCTLSFPAGSRDLSCYLQTEITTRVSLLQGSLCR